MRLLLLLVFLAGCGSLQLHKPKEPKPETNPSALQAVYDRELALYGAETAATQGWPSETDCDATLWAGLACAGGAPVAIERAEYSPGELHRRPAPSCWTKEGGDEGARSTNSRDMETGYLACLWARRDASALKRHGDFAEAHTFVMGQPTSEPVVLLMPNLAGLLGRMIYEASGGADDRAWRIVPYDYNAVESDYEEHLEAEGIELQGDVAGGITDDAKGRLDSLAELRPDDFLIQAVAAVYSGDYDHAIDLLLDPATPAPSYVRGDQAANYRRALWLRAARIVLNRVGDG